MILKINMDSRTFSALYSGDEIHRTHLVTNAMFNSLQYSTLFQRHLIPFCKANIKYILSVTLKHHIFKSKDFGCDAV
jgi:hypothetical protein